MNRDPVFLKEAIYSINSDKIKCFKIYSYNFKTMLLQPPATKLVLRLITKVIFSINLINNTYAPYKYVYLSSKNRLG